MQASMLKSWPVALAAAAILAGGVAVVSFMAGLSLARKAAALAVLWLLACLPVYDMFLIVNTFLNPFHVVPLMVLDEVGRRTWYKGSGNAVTGPLREGLFLASIVPLQVLAWRLVLPWILGPNHEPRRAALMAGLLYYSLNAIVMFAVVAISRKIR